MYPVGMFGRVVMRRTRAAMIGVSHVAIASYHPAVGAIADTLQTIESRRS
jgi:hypothetical protein